MIYAKVDKDTKEILEYPVDTQVVIRWCKQNSISIGENIDDYDLTAWGWYKVDYVQLPMPSQIGYKCVLDTPIWDGDTLIRTFKEVLRTPEETEELWLKVRLKRNRLLDESDWVELPSVVNQRTETWQLAWKNYRNKLRDITKTDDPLMIEWPTVPENDDE